VWTTRLNAVVEVDVSDALRKITHPVLYLRATDDVLVSRRAMEVVLAIKAGVKVVEIPGPHFLLQTKGRESAAAVSRFLRQSTYLSGML
jgi:pimeloyl-ACP methyl ester carboxylesterase